MATRVLILDRSSMKVSSSTYLPARCLFRVDKCEASFLSQVFDRLNALGVEEIGSWSVLLQVLVGESRPPPQPPGTAVPPAAPTAPSSKGEKRL